jgi:CheY-like chemotaxis protein
MPTSIEKNRVLVVDDVEVNRILAFEYFKMLGWNVDECSGGYSALEYLQKKIPECILLDIRMPDIDGLELLRIIRTKHPVGTIKVVAYTAHAILEEVSRIRASGFDDVLIKPITFNDVAAIFGRKNSKLSPLG